ncbi:autotransporter outer membrane beta-barrel domain-containing protein [Hydromonas duriensis]|uniref:Outer membrane autotransporter protein n=1 Tax=Hydromonas duriensis TaxID=1527608 RepID=A0A4R6Y6V9_9BURK|nr:autotransporter outer membrane beta-barrel domain-containing protein [Hydromonas duriensis]TDR28908.1 outer membrane autotransporter protein [Hydromonas duriensis]
MNRLNQKQTTIALTVIAASLLYPTTNAMAACAVILAGASAANGSICNVPAGTYNTIHSSSAGILNLGGDTTVNGSGSSGLYSLGSGSNINSTGLVTVVKNVTDDLGIATEEKGSINLNNVNIQINGVFDTQGISAISASSINVVGDAVVNTTGDGGVNPWKGNQGVVAGSAASVNLNTASIKTLGNYSSGIAVGLDMASVNASGQTTVDTRGQYADAIFVAEQGRVSLNGAALLLTYGTHSSAIRVANDAGIASNQVTVSNGTLSTAQANVIEANGGASSITLSNTTSRAPSGYVFLNVDNGSSLAATGFGTAVSYTPNAALLNFTANNNSVLTGDAVVANDGSTANLNFANGSIYNGAMTNVTNVAIDASSLWNMAGNSSISRDLNNAGTVNFQNLGNALTINGNYTGTAGSVISLETQLGDDNSPTDKLHVVGNTTGTTQLNIRNAGGTGAQTVNGINVVQVDGTSAANSFTMAAPVQAGSYEYTLKQGSALDANDWYLTSKYTTNPAPCVGSSCSNVVDIYRPGIAAYVAAQTANADAAFTHMSTLHQRMAEQRHTATDTPQTWGRVFAAGQSNNGKTRFEYDQTSTGFEFGRDVMSTINSAGQAQRAGVTLNYTHSNVDARDRIRPLVGLAQNTGSLNSNAIGLGGYYTQYSKNGLYLDTVAQINHLTNKYNDSYGGASTQHGWQFGLSGEVGMPVASLSGWSVEPQAQLSYLYTKYSDFNDAYSNIHYKNNNSLRGRLGLRLSKDSTIDGQAAQYYGITNVVYDFIKPSDIELTNRTSTGSSSVGEQFDRSYGEIGGGIQGSLSKSTDMYADARYQRSFNGNKEGVQFNIGVKAKF